MADGDGQASVDRYALVGCVCAPGFEFEDFELAKRAKILADLRGLTANEQRLIELITVD
jgi:predicted cupin superfamily sugar epimerase